MSGRNAPKQINLKQRNRKVDTEEKLIEYIKTQLGAPLITVDVTDDQILQCIDETFQKFSDWTWDAQQNQVFIINGSPGIQDYIIDERIKAIYGISIGDTLSGYSSSSGGGMMAGIPMGSFMPPMYIPAITMEGNQSSLTNPGAAMTGGSATGVAGGVAGGAHTSGNKQNGNPLEAAWAAMTDMQTMQSMFGSTISFDFNASNHTLRIFEEAPGPIAIEAAIDYIPNPDYDPAYNDPWIKMYSKALTKRVWSGNVGKYSSELIGGSTINYERIGSEAQEEIDKLEESLMMQSEALGAFSG